MDINQSTELSYIKLTELDTKVNELLDVVTDSNPENSTTLKELTNEIKTNTELIKGKVNSVIDALNSGPEVDTSNIETQLTEVSSAINDMDAKVTTINSNVSTIYNNTSLMKSDVTKMKENMSTNTQGQEINGKLDELLRRITLNNEEEYFEEDPFKLDLEYTERLEGDRNPSNYDYYEQTKDFETNKGIYIALADSEDTKYSYKMTLTFSCDTSCTICSYDLKTRNYYNYEAGTHTITFSATDKEITEERIAVGFYVQSTGATITVHHFKFEVWANNVIILNRKTKYKVYNSVENIAISKVENHDGYYLVLDKNNLTPSKLKQEYTLGCEGVKDFSYGFITKTFYTNTKDFHKIKTATRLNYKHYASFDNDYYVYNVGSTFVYNISLGYSDTSNLCMSSIGCEDSSQPYLFFIKTNAISSSRLKASTFLPKNIVDCCSVMDMGFYTFDDKQASVVTDYKGNNYLYFYSTKYYLPIGYGKNATAFYYKDNLNFINIYLNDNGYCVKYVVQVAEDKLSAEVLTKKIIGTYDAYHETSSDVYFVEKDQQLYMFKNK